MNEIYDIVGYDGKYGITKNGIVYSYFKYGKRLSKEDYIELKSPTDKDGYYTVFLYKKGKAQHERVHRLVALTFINKKEFKCMPDEDKENIDLNVLQVNHKDENKQNNCVENLEWCTSKYNANYGVRNIKCIKKISKPIIQYDLNMNEICIYKNGCEIKRKLGYDNSTIAKRCKDYKKGYNCYWRYANEQKRIRKNNK